nr:hypothetical protein Iba_chr03cCG6090 [Ipomoea batatas]
MSLPVVPQRCTPGGMGRELASEFSTIHADPVLRRRASLIPSGLKGVGPSQFCVVTGPARLPGATLLVEPIVHRAVHGYRRLRPLGVSKMKIAIKCGRVCRADGQGRIWNEIHGERKPSRSPRPGAIVFILLEELIRSLACVRVDSSGALRTPLTMRSTVLNAHVLADLYGAGRMLTRVPSGCESHESRHSQMLLLCRTSCSDAQPTNPAATLQIRVKEYEGIFLNFIFIRSDLYQPRAWEKILQESSMEKIGIEVVSHRSVASSATRRSPRAGNNRVGVIILLRGFLIAIVDHLRPFPFSGVFGSRLEISHQLLDIVVVSDGGANQRNLLHLIAIVVVLGGIIRRIFELHVTEVFLVIPFESRGNV